MSAPQIPPEQLLSEETLPGGQHHSLLLRRGHTLRLTDLEGGANVSALFYNQEEKSERYNMADTLKAQHIAHLTTGAALYSDMGRILISIPYDDCGWHDPIGGVSDAELVREKYGPHEYQEFRNDYYRNGYDSFVIQLGRWGLTKRDIVPNVNLFSKVVVDAGGALQFAANHSRPGACVELRAEMHTLVILNSCPHPLDPAPAYPIKPVRLSVWRSGPGGGPDDPCRNFRPENDRGYRNTFAWFAGRSSE
jgi:uncharacterized protein